LAINSDTDTNSGPPFPTTRTPLLARGSSPPRTRCGSTWRLAEQGADTAFADDPGFARGLNIKGGEIVYEPVATAYAQGAPVAAW
jgi:hypothetical protein